MSLRAATSLTAVTSAQAKDYSTIRFGVDASYPPFESKGSMASWSVSTSISAMKSARA